MISIHHTTSTVDVMAAVRQELEGGKAGGDGGDGGAGAEGEKKKKKVGGVGVGVYGLGEVVY